MTNEEAIKMLKSKLDGNTDTSYEWAECVRLSVNALEEISKKPKTNADRIRQMTDEELAELLSAVKNYCIKIPCGKCDFYDAESSVDDIICNPLKWLKQEASEDATERTD